MKMMKIHEQKSSSTNLSHMTTLQKTLRRESLIIPTFFFFNKYAEHEKHRIPSNSNPRFLAHRVQRTIYGHCQATTTHLPYFTGIHHVHANASTVHGLQEETNKSEHNNAAKVK
jgi:hypothetical protein